MKILHSQVAHTAVIAIIVMAFCSSCSSKENRVYELETDATEVLKDHAVQLIPAFPKLMFENPLDIQMPSDGSNRMFVVEQQGRILVFPKDSNAPSHKVFLDIRNRVDFDHNEQGLLGLAFDPNFEQNGFFYVDYVANKPLRTVIARFKVAEEDKDKADDQSEMVILEISQPYSNHNGGRLSFGPDGFLYIGMGDGGGAGDPHGNGQNRAELLGKILRIDVSHAQNGKNYAIPPDNPFVGNHEGWREEIFAYGIRNPWRFSWDSQGRLWAADVGQDKYEEVDIVEKGKNYGWNIMEGAHCFKPETGCATDSLEMPVIEYDHIQGRSVTGGFVYEGKRLKSILGHYIFADFVTGKIWSYQHDPEKTSLPTLIAQAQAPLASFGRDDEGELYAACFDGQIYKLSDNL